MPLKLQYEDFNPNGYSEFTPNQYRRTLPNTADILQNMKPGIMCATEGGFQHFANRPNSQQFPRIPPEFLGKFSLGAQYEAKAAIDYRDDIYILIAGEYIPPNLGNIAHEVEGVAILLKYSVIADYWNIVSNIAPSADSDGVFNFNSRIRPVQYDLFYNSNKECIVIKCSEYLAEYFIHKTSGDRWVEHKDYGSNIIISQISTIPATTTQKVSGNNIDTTYAGYEWLFTWANNKGFNAPHTTRAGWFMQNFPQNSERITQGGKSGRQYTADLGTLNPSQTDLTTAFQTQYSGNLQDGDIVTNTNNNLTPQNWGYNLSAGLWQISYIPPETIIALQVNAGTTNNANPTISYIFQPVRLETSEDDAAYVKPVSEVLISSENIIINLPNGVASNFVSVNEVITQINQNISLSGKPRICTIAPPAFNLMGGRTVMIDQNLESFAMNIKGTITQPYGLGNYFTHIRIYRTVQAEFSEGAAFHHIIDKKLEDDGITFNLNEYSGFSTTQIPPNNNFALQNFAYDKFVRQELKTYNSFGKIFSAPELVAVNGEYDFIVHENKIYATQPYRNGNIVDGSYWIEPNRGYLQCDDKILNIAVNNDTLYVLTEKGLYTLEYLSVSVTVDSGGWRVFKKSLIKRWESAFSFREQLYIADDGTFYAINNYGELLFESGEIFKEWSYKDRYAGVNNLQWCSTLTRLVITSAMFGGILNQRWSCFIDDELYNGWYSYCRNWRDNSFEPDSSMLRQDRFIMLNYKGGIFLIYNNTTGVNIVEMFQGFSDNLLVEDIYAKAEE